MYCKKCGRELTSDTRYCPSCGAEVTAQQTYEDPFTTTVTLEEKKPAKVWSIFSKIGKILGIVSIATSWIPFLIGLTVGIPGIVLSCLGRKAGTEVAQKNFKLGLILSIVGVVVSFFSYLIFYIIIIVSASGY